LLVLMLLSCTCMSFVLFFCVGYGVGGDVCFGVWF